MVEQEDYSEPESNIYNLLQKKLSPVYNKVIDSSFGLKPYRLLIKRSLKAHYTHSVKKGIFLA